MKRFISLLLPGLSFFTNPVTAQTADRAIGQASYRLTHVRDTTQRNNPYTEDLVLLIGKNASSFSSIDAAKYKQQRDSEIDNQVKIALDPARIDLTISGSRPVNTSEYYQYQSENKLFTKQILINPYLTEASLPVIKWNLLSDTTTILGLHCQKASTQFLGRDYIAWFTPDIPFHAGPWKLHGLPGLIIQVSDLKNEVKFEFLGFEDLRKQNINILLPDDAIRISLSDLNRLQKLEKNDPAAFSKLPASKNLNNNTFGTLERGRINSIKIKRPAVSFSTVVNNPIELSAER